MKKFPLILLFAVLVFLSGCSNDIVYSVYYPFENQSWERFNLLQFEIPVERSEGLYTVDLFVRHTQEFEFDKLDLHMIMNTPAGEERIREYSIVIRRKDGGFTGQCTRDSCEVVHTLKKEMFLTKGTLTIRLENLIPRLRAGGLLGVGIRVIPVGD